MEKKYYVGQCSICHDYGRLEICKNEDDNQYLAICDECLAEWKNPEDALKNTNGKRENIKKGKVLNATFDEIKKIGWDRFVVNR